MSEPTYHQDTFRQALHRYSQQPDAPLRDDERAQIRERLALRDREGKPVPFSQDTMDWHALAMRHWAANARTPESAAVVRPLERYASLEQDLHFAAQRTHADQERTLEQEGATHGRRL